MNQFGRVNVANEMPAPTGCDVRQVQAAYKQLTLKENRATVGAKIGEDKGEEPVDDDTPIVVRNP